MICKKCGAFNEEGTNFCANCGENLRVAEQVVQPESVVENVVPTGYVQNPEPVKQPAMGLAIAAMICGIVSFLCFWYITGPLGIIFGAVAKNKGCKSGMATAGIVCGIIGVALGIVFVVLLKGATNALVDMMGGF